MAGGAGPGTAWPGRAGRGRAGAGRGVAWLRGPGRGGRCGEPGLPGRDAVAVGAARIRGDQQPPRPGVVGAAAALPPAAGRFDGERGGVMVGADVHPPGVRGQVVDPVRDRLALWAGEVVVADLDRVALGPPLPPGVLILPDLLLLLGVHADHRVAGILVRPGLL